MKEKSKAHLGLRINNRLLLTDDEKLLIIEDYLAGTQTKQEVYEKHTGPGDEHGKITLWMRKFSIKDKFVKNSNFASMPTQKKDNEHSSEDFETLKLKKRIAELEKQLQTAEMKAIAFSTMVDIAEKEFNIPIRKKHNTKL